MLAATACAATRSSAARLAETPSTAITLSGPRARAASASSTEESTPPEKATPSRRVLASAANKPATASWSPARNDVNGICVPPAPWDGSLTLCGRSTTNQPGPARHPERLASCLENTHPRRPTSLPRHTRPRTRFTTNDQEPYWRPAYFLAEERIPAVRLPPNAEHLRNLPLRKTDVADSAWRP